MPSQPPQTQSSAADGEEAESIRADVERLELRLEDVVRAAQTLPELLLNADAWYRGAAGHAARKTSAVLPCRVGWQAWQHAAEHEKAGLEERHSARRDPGSPRAARVHAFGWTPGDRGRAGGPGQASCARRLPEFELRRDTMGGI